MKGLVGVSWVLALAAAYGLGVWGSSSSERAPTAPASFAAAIEHRNPLVRSFEISRFLRNLTPQELPDVLQVVEASGFWFKGQDYHLLMAAWVPIDALAAMDWALSRPVALKGRASTAAVEEIAFHDPSRALSFVMPIESPGLKETLHLSMVRGWSRSKHRDSLTLYLSQQPVGGERRRATAALVDELLKQGTDAVIAWADAVPDDAQRAFKRTAFQTAVSAIADFEPARAAHWVDDGLGQENTAGATKTVAARWIEREPAAAMDWLLSLPEGSQHVRSAFFRWMNTDSGAAEAWAGSAAPAAAADPAVRVLVHRYSESNPVAAMEWADRIHDPVVRLRVLASTGRAWLERDRDALMAWLPESGLDRQVRDLILNTPMKKERESRRGPEGGTRGT